MRVPRNIRFVDGKIPRLSKPPTESLAKGHPTCSLIVGLPPEKGPINPICETWAIATNGVVCAISQVKILTDVKDHFVSGLVMPIPYDGGGFTDMTTNETGVRMGTKKKGDVANFGVFSYGPTEITDAVKSWRVNFDKLLEPVVSRLKKPTDESPVVYVAFTKEFIAEVAACSGDSFWLAIPAVRAQPGVYVSDSSPTIGGCDSGEAFAISLPFFDTSFKRVIESDHPGLNKVLPKIRDKAAQITRFLRHLGSLIGKSVETDVPADW